jgi:hypothetical protein
MTTKRSLEIQNEISRRVDIWLNNETFENMTCGYSKLKFEMAIGLLGYPFEKPEWMNINDFKKFVTKKEYESFAVKFWLDDAYDWCINHEDEINEAKNIINSLKNTLNKIK